MPRRNLAFLAVLALPALSGAQVNDEAYTKKIREYTTEAMFLTERVDHLPASLKAEKAAAVDCPVGKGHVVLFANNPMWRWQTHGSHALVFNAILNWDNLGVGRAAAAPAKAAADEKK
jgi:hypothetical protein